MGQYFYAGIGPIGRNGRKDEQGQTQTIQVQSGPNHLDAWLQKEKEGKETNKRTAIARRSGTSYIVFTYDVNVLAGLPI